MGKGNSESKSSNSVIRLTTLITPAGGRPTLVPLMGVAGNTRMMLSLSNYTLPPLLGNKGVENPADLRGYS
tara:strand:+ start:231 stop:443 length:213 start_codon:yes stop_codon:yes gene_type:complete